MISAVLQADKQSAEDDKILVAAAQALLQKIPPLKHLYIVDTDIDPHSVEDVLWAMTTRFQADIDFYPQRSERRFMPDPSQWPPYREDPQELPMKALFDCTVPFKLKNIFRRAFQPN